MTEAIFCKELNQHFLSHFDAKKELLQLGYQIGNIPSVLRGDCKTTGGLSFSYSDLDDDNIKNQKPAEFVDFLSLIPSNSPKIVFCIELGKMFPFKSAAIKTMKESGHPPLTQKTLSKAI